MWDRYLENSLKQGTREARGTGTRRRVCDSAAIPLNWKSFVRLDDNKKELFQYLTASVQSYFSGKGKKTAYHTWKCYPEAIECFHPLSSPQAMLSEEQFRVLERFVVIMYNRTTPHQDVNKARLSMFSQGTRSIESIPPTQAALAQHVRREACQESSISSWSCLGMHTRSHSGTSKCSRMGMASIFRWMDTDLDNPT